MKLILSVTSFFNVCPLRRTAGGRMFLGDRPRWRKFSGPVREIEINRRENA